MVDASDLIIPVYLNQRVVFDLVAVLEGGIASVTQVSHTQAQSASEVKQIGASFGLSQALSSLLKIDLTGKQDKKSAEETNTTKNEDRIHTPVSLFIALRARLRERGCLRDLTQDSRPVPGDLVEFSSALHRNPFIETLDAFVSMVDMFQAFADTQHKGKGKQANEAAQMKKQIGPLLASLKSGDTMDLTTPALPSSHRAVISLETQYLNDPTMSDLVDGTFKVVGKVTRCLGESEGAVSLNRKSAINHLPSAALEQLNTAFQHPDLAIMSLPKFEWEIRAPVMQILPIAIFT